MERDAILKTEMLAYIGEDELGSGEIGLKQGMTQLGLIPLAFIGTHRDRAESGPMKMQMALQARAFDKPIYLVRYAAVEIIKVYEP